MIWPLHGIGSRRDLPLPFEFVVIGAAGVLLITFAVLWWAWRSPRWSAPGGRALPRLTAFIDHRVTRVVAAVAVIAANLWFMAAVVWGQDLLTNPVFGWVYACWWVGLVPVSLVAGGIWRPLHPAWTLATLLSSGRDRTESWRRIGVWPAAIGVAVFGFVELVQPSRATLGVLGVWLTIYWLAMLGGVVLFGRVWVAAADPFSAYAELVARLSPWQRIDGQIALVNPLRHLTTAPVPRGTTALVSALLGATAFDSLSGSSGWIGWAQNTGLEGWVVGLGGLALMIGVVGLTLGLALRSMRRWQLPGADEATEKLATTAAPIVVGYAIGHYASLLLTEGQRTFIHASDPFSLGWNVFGTAERGVWVGWLDNPTAVALVQLIAIVGGHVVGVLAAHERSLHLLRPRAAVRGQLPLLAVMVGYTVGGLLLLFTP